MKNLPNPSDLMDLDDYEELQTPNKETSFLDDTKRNLEIGARGVGQYAGQGFGDEAEAGIKSLLNKSNYDEELKNARLENFKAGEENPLLYHGAGLASDLALGYATGGLSKSGLALNAGLGALSGIGQTDENKISGDTIQNAIIGGALGAGGDLLGTGLGIGVKKLTSKISNALPDKKELLKQGISNLTSKNIDPLLGVDLEVEKLYKSGKPDEAKKLIQENLKNVDEMVGMEYDTKIYKSEVANKILKHFENSELTKRAGQNKKLAMDSLELNDNVANLNEAKNSLQNSLLKLKNKDGKIVGLSNNSAARKINYWNKELDKYGKMIDQQTPIITREPITGMNITTYKISKVLDTKNLEARGKDARKLIDSIDDDIDIHGNWNDPTNFNQPVVNALKDMRKKIDTSLRGQNNEYDVLMKNVSHDTTLNSIMLKKVATKGKGIDEKKIEQLVDQLTGNKLYNEDKKTIKRLSESYSSFHSNNDIEKELNLIKMKKAFEQPVNQGSNVMNQFGMLGTSIGGGVVGSQTSDSSLGGYGGMAAGALAGSYMQKHGGKVAKKLIDMSGINNNSQSTLAKLKGTKYYEPMKQAIDRGGNSFAVNHFLLSQKDKNYQEELAKQKGSEK